MGRIEMKFARTRKFGGRMLPVILCQGLFGLLPLSSSIHAQGGATTKTKQFEFEVVSIRKSPQVFAGRGLMPDGFHAMMSIEYLIKLGYGEGMVSPNGDRTHVINLPKWANQTYYQIDARVAEEDLKAWQNQSQDKDLMRSAMRQMLKERFHLVLHEQEAQRDGYRLVVRSQGARFKPTPAGFVPPPGMKLPGGGVVAFSPNKNWQFYASSMTELAYFLNRESNGPIYDGTNLAGRYDFTLQPEEQAHDAGGMSPQYNLTSLGLELKPGKGPGKDLIVDHLEKPTPN